MSNNNNEDPIDPSKIPALFATIHWRSPSRPDGYTDEEVWCLNYDANRHLPDLQRSLLKDWDRELAAMTEDEFEARLLENVGRSEILSRMMEARARGLKAERPADESPGSV